MSLIHRFKGEGSRIVLDINSGSIHLVDEVTWEILPLLEEGCSDEQIRRTLGGRFEEAEIDSAIKECRILQEQRQLFTVDAYENAVDVFMQNRAPVVKALCLHVAHDCNLSCQIGRAHV